MDQKIQGLISAPPAAFHPDGTVNLEIIPQLAAWLYGNGVVGAFVNGSTGEGLSLTVEERMAIAEQWVKTAPPDFKVIIHVAHSSAPSAWQLASHAASIGAKAIAEIGPVVFRPKNVKALAEHAAQTASRASELSYYYYHIPSISGVFFPMIDFLKEADLIIPNLAGLKYTYEDFMDMQMCREFKNEKYDILYGRDETLLCGLALGFRGAVGSTYNIMAPLYNQIIKAFDSGNLDEARRLQLLSVKAIRLLVSTSCFFSALKEVLKMLGLDLGGVRTPLQRISEEEIQTLKDGLNQIGFFEYAQQKPTVLTGS